jgi:hypothetical protein
MKRTTLFLGLLFVPAATFAMDFTNVSSRYTDAPFNTAESAGISVLTNLGAITGNPNGTFAPKRTVNRAEFLKILFGSQPSLSVSISDSAHCFPDVQTGDWFSRYVCASKLQAIVGGYPDGFFRPADPVNYAEALKILATSYNETLPTPGPTERWAWYTEYLRAATTDGVTLPGVDVATPLTRGQVARLAAGYRAWHDGVLSQYRAFERGEVIRSSSSSSSMMSMSSQSSSSSSASSLSSSLSSSSSSVSATLFPATSHFFLIGQQSPIAIDGTFTSPDEDGILRFVDVTLRQEVKSIQDMTVMDTTGQAIGTLTLTTDNNADHRKWRLTLPDSSTYRLPRGVPTILGVAYNLRTHDNGGVNNEFIDGIESFSITVSGASTNASKQLIPTNTHYPQSQTADAKVTGITNSGAAISSLHATTNQVIGQFRVSGQTATGGILHLSSLRFTLNSNNVSVSNIRIGGTFPVQQADCGVDGSDSTKVNCSIIPTDFQEVTNHGQVLTIMADVSLNAGAPSGALQITFADRGKIGQTGALTWKDTTGTYNWIEPSAALENGTAWTVTP